MKIMITATKKPVFVEAQQCFKQLLTIVIFFIIGFNTCNSLAQESRKDGCSTDALHLELLKTNAKYKENFDANNTSWQKYNIDKIKDDKDVKNRKPNVLTSAVTLDRKSVV